MPRLVEGLSRFFGRVEIFALGLDGERKAAEEALTRGQPLEAREHARALLAALPESPLGLALWADAAEDAWLDHEVVAALSKLSEKVPWRADVWLRLGRAGARIEWPGAREALERAAVAPDERDSARLALLDLADRDLAAGDAARAQRWLDRIAAPLTGVDREVAVRRAEFALAQGDAAQAAHEVEKVTGANGPAAVSAFLFHVLRGAGARSAAQMHRQHQPQVGPLSTRAASSSPTDVFANDPGVARSDAKQRDGGPLRVTTVLLPVPER